MIKKDEKPFVSVIIPVYNAEKFIKPCITSLLNQDYENDKIEIITIDNNSTDNSKEILKSFPVKYLFTKKPGPSAARNAGLKEAKGDFILLLDADCIASRTWISNHIEAHNKLIKSNPNYKIVGGSIRGINQNYWALCDDFNSWSDEHPAQKPKENVFYCATANLSFSRDILDQYSIYFDEDLKFGEDVDFCRSVCSKNFHIYFEPKAELSHINRISFRSFTQHARNWAISEISLQKKGIINKINKSNFKLFWHYTCGFFANIWKILINCLRCGRFHIFICYPFIILNQFIFFSECYNLMIKLKLESKTIDFNPIKENL